MSFPLALTQGLSVAGLLFGLGVSSAAAQVRRDEQFYYPGRFNWQFLANYPEAARLFHAFDYGHAVLCERLYTKGVNAGPALEREYRYLTTDLLIRPPRFAVAEEAIMPSCAKAAWRVKMMFDWAHELQRQIYDAYADERLPPVQRDSLIEQLTDYYLSNRKYAFTDKPKSMALMNEQYFSQTFRKAYPTFNGLIWAYHWLQVGLYEPYLGGQTEAARKAGVQTTIARFWSMLEDPPARMPKVMPMTAAVAPTFSAAHPRAAVIFDNLHLMHDILSDVLTADTIPRHLKGEMIDQQLDQLQDPSRDVISMDEWRNMADHMGGVELMGGRATALVRVVQAPSTQLPADGGHADHDKARIDRPMNGVVADPMPHAGASIPHRLKELHQGVRNVENFTANLVKAPIGTPDTNSSTATGSATMSVVGGLLLYRVDVTGLRNATVAHIHGPAAPGLSAPVIVDLCGTTQGPGGPPTTPPCVSGTGTLGSGVAPPVKNMSFDRLLVLLRNDSAYVNVHTTAHPGGEIRGTIVRP